MSREEATIECSTGVILEAIGFVTDDWRGSLLMVAGCFMVVFGLLRYFKASEKSWHN